MKPETCKNCCSREFIEQQEAYVCAYCDTRYPKIVAAAKVDPAEITLSELFGDDGGCEPVPEEAGNGKRKNKWVAFLLCLFLGCYGGHKFYEGRIGMGILYFFTAGLLGIGWLVDCIVLLRKPNPYYV